MNPPPTLTINKDVQFLEQETTTLLVKNLPDLPESDRLDFLKHFGPQEVRLGTSKSMKNSAFLDFPDRLSATNAFSKLQELGDVGGKKIRVEYALPSKEALQKKTGGNSEDSTNENKRDNLEPSQPPPPPPPFPPPPSFVAEPIAPSLGINYPAPPTLRYRYPPPTVEILYNIMNAIAAVPKLYTQVLHLMNKMNLPPPFGPILPESIPTLLQQHQMENQDIKGSRKKSRKRDELLSEDESEIDSEDEEEHIPIKKSRTSEILPGAVPPIPVASYMNPMFIGAPVEPISTESVTPIAAPHLAPLEQFHNNSFQPEVKPEETEINTSSPIQQAESPIKCITLEELNSNKMPVEELIKISAMKNYEPGQPNSTLYIKNLAPKKVKKEDLEHLFGRYFHTKSQMDIRLLPRGQAFVIFSNVEMATQALNDVHGYILYNKPMVIQFSNKTS
ncbi:hypothetical protein RclHR1_02110008 [Rhizophagus clarus]|uniref:U11/U12 small nuclear ribonucleoprotein 65 kDa protein n=1 Tax=Rhizophagus clarus TaxID=94130 RepID=A0A2Z6R548_9GLOM|nr:hypothetical protein RclHR1_02110008 [Rhizophagus clarus]GES81468.1 U11/U12 small nuclear ribonucleoprotein 65 kDa protein [Rhizophagus clarus]